LFEIPAVRIYRDSNGIEECGIEAVEFYPELKYDLYFTNVLGLPPLRVRDPQKAAPLHRLTSPFHVACPSGIALLHYVEYPDEILRGAEIPKQPRPFLSFARQAREWLHQNYLPKRGRNTADKSTNDRRLLRRKGGDQSPASQN
jgi:hypothetical protein